MHEWQGRRVSDPLDRLRVGHHPDVVHRDNGVEEGDEAFFMMRLGEPGGVVEEPEGRSVKEFTLSGISYLIVVPGRSRS